MSNYKRYVMSDLYPPSILDQYNGDTYPINDEGIFETVCELLNEQYSKLEVLGGLVKIQEEEIDKLKIGNQELKGKIEDKQYKKKMKRDYTSQNQIKKLEAKNHQLKEALESCKRLNKRITTNCENFAEQVEKELIK